MRDKRECHLNATSSSILTALKSIKIGDWRAGLSISSALEKNCSFVITGIIKYLDNYFGLRLVE